MIRTIEAIIEADGQVRLLEQVRVLRAQRALLTILDEPAVEEVNSSTSLSEPALEDWNGPEEEEAWSHLQPER